MVGQFFYGRVYYTHMTAILISERKWLDSFFMSESILVDGKQNLLKSVQVIVRLNIFSNIFMSAEKHCVLKIQEKK